MGRVCRACMWGVGVHSRLEVVVVVISLVIVGAEVFIYGSGGFRCVHDQTFRAVTHISNSSEIPPRLLVVGITHS